MTKDKCTIILGMHKSSHSALAGCLRILGVNLGNTLSAAGDSSKGNGFINQDIALAHDILLRDLGCRWDMVGSLPRGWLESEASLKAEETLRGILERQFLGDGPFAISDPRMCRLMPLWTRLLNRLDIKPCLALWVRRPMEVAALLEKEHGFDPHKGHLLWLVHNRDALTASRGYEHQVIIHDRFLEDPVGNMDSLVQLSSLKELTPRNHSRDILDVTAQEPQNFFKPADGEQDGRFALYEQIFGILRNLDQGQTELDSHADVLADHASALQVADNEKGSSSNLTAGVMNSLLDLIRRHEQTELDANIRRERLFLSSGDIAEPLVMKIVPPLPEDKPHTGDQSRKFIMAPGEWHNFSIDIRRPELLRTGRLCINPLNSRGMVTISAIKLVNMVSGDICWSAGENFQDCEVQGDAFVLNTENSLQLVCTGNQPSILLPPVSDLPDVPMRLDIWIKSERNQGGAQKWFTDLQEQIQAKDQSLTDLQEQIQAKDQSLTDLQEQLESQKDLTREYFQALAEAEEEQEKIRSRVHVLEQQNQQLQHGIQQLRKDFNKLLESRRWKVGTALIGVAAKVLRRSGRKTAADRMLETLDKLDHPERQPGPSVPKTETAFEPGKVDGRRMVKDMDRLHKDFQTLLRSRRWKMGNAVGKVIGAVLLRSGKDTAADRIQQILSQFQEWRQSIEPEFLGPNETRKLQRWISRLDRDFQALLRSRRWKIGNKLGNAAGRIFRRPGKPGAVDRMENILEKYR